MGILPGIPTNIPMLTGVEARVTMPDDVTPLDADDDITFWFLITSPHATMFVTDNHRGHLITQDMNC